MRQSPTKVVFNYQQGQESQYIYSPKVIQSGFIVGEPVAYTDAPRLPSNYRSFSPTVSRPRAATDIIGSSRRVDYEAPEPSRFAPPPHRPSFPLRQLSPIKSPRGVSQE
jgi:hypothetical protein